MGPPRPTRRHFRSQCHGSAVAPVLALSLSLSRVATEPAAGATASGAPRNRGVLHESLRRRRGAPGPVAPWRDPPGPRAPALTGSAIPSDSESPSSSPSPTSSRPCPDPLLLSSFWTALVFHCDLPHERPHLKPVFP